MSELYVVIITKHTKLAELEAYKFRNTLRDTAMSTYSNKNYIAHIIGREDMAYIKLAYPEHKGLAHRLHHNTTSNKSKEEIHSGLCAAGWYLE